MYIYMHACVIWSSDVYAGPLYVLSLLCLYIQAAFSQNIPDKACNSSHCFHVITVESIGALQALSQVCTEWML